MNMKSGIKQRENNKAQSRSSENVNKINKLLKNTVEKGKDQVDITIYLIDINKIRGCYK